MIKTYNLETGDILVCKAESNPFLEHFGVVVQESTETMVYHILPQENVRKDSLKNFLRFRPLIEVRKTTASRDQILDRLAQVRKMEYDVLNFNCVHFAEYLTT